MKRRALLLAMLMLSVSGCAHLASTSAARLMVRAPNKVDPRIRLRSLRPLSPPSDDVAERFWVEVGPPRARLLVWTMDPTSGRACPTGTILLLHGAYERSEDMLGMARVVRDGGYRAVLVDMRGHGRSTGERITYGAQESKDLVQLVDVLQERRLLAGKLGVYGFSFGAATAIDLAGRDPRVEAVVAVAPYASFHKAASEAMRARVSAVRRFASQEWIDRTIREAGRVGGFDSESTDPIAAIQRTHAMVLMIHGDSDTFVEPYHSELLHRAASDHSGLAIVPGAEHHDLAGANSESATSLALSWFNQWLPPVAEGPTPQPSLSGG
jgi:pimeloyl-ACP methyl ester carboxylesterase